MKIIDRYMLSSFLGPFLITFFVVLFALSMQVLWLYSDDIIGKGIESYVIAEMMMYLCVTMVPMALPLAILLSSIMSFGNLSEHYEMIAMKAAGIPLFRIMSSLIILVIFIAIGTFFFSNKVIPYANFKFENMLGNIVNQKPAMKIMPGIFDNSLNNLSIRVAKKMPMEDYDYIENVFIYDFRDYRGNVKLITAASGTLQTSKDKRYLIITLFNGQNYEEVFDQSGAARKDQPIYKGSFDKQVIPVDISSLSRSMQENRKGSFTMLDINQLSDTLVVMRGNFEQTFTNRADEIQGIIMRRTLSSDFDSLRNILAIPPTGILPQIRFSSAEEAVLNNAMESSRQLKDNINAYIETVRPMASYINRFDLEIQRKFALAFSAIVLFFVGAPLGALIRKGGIGLPIVVAISIYVIYHIMFMTGERMGIEGTIDVITARWLPTYVLLPFGIWLTYRASKDKPVIVIGSAVYAKLARFREWLDRWKQERQRKKAEKKKQ